MSEDANGWRPWNSAPKDGTKIIAMGSDLDYPEVVYWMQYDPADAKEAGAPGCWLYAEELLANVADVLESEYGFWMPVPPLPAT